MKKKLLIISPFLPLPISSGQKKRLYDTIVELKKIYLITLLSVNHKKYSKKNKVNNLVDELILMPSLVPNNFLLKLIIYCKGIIHMILHGTKLSNYIIQELQFNPVRVSKYINPKDYDFVIMEYFHLFNCVNLFKKHSVKTCLDTHNVLYFSFQQQLRNKKIPNIIKKYLLNKYQQAEINAWKKFDYLISINQYEEEYIKKFINPTKVWNIPIGMNFDKIKNLNDRKLDKIVIAFFGGFSSKHNQRYALECYYKTMNAIWMERADIEYWIIGNNPPKKISDLADRDSRVKVTGFVEQLETVFKDIAFVLCPWEGAYGFRTRIVEVMAYGIPVVATKNSIQGMQLENKKGIILTDSIDDFSNVSLELIKNINKINKLSILARKEVSKYFSFDSTYSVWSQNIFMVLNEE